MDIHMNHHGRRIAIRWILFVLFVSTIPTVWFIGVAGGLAPTIQLLSAGIVAVFNLGGNGNFIISIGFLASGLVASLLYYFLAYFLSKPLAAIKRDHLRTWVLVMITTGLIAMACFPIYYEGGHNTGQAVNILAYKDIKPGLFYIFTAVLFLLIAVLFVLQHRSVPIRGLWKSSTGKLFVLLMSGGFLVGFVYTNNARVICMPAAQLGISSAQVCMGRAVANGNITQVSRVNTAREWYKKAAEQGSIEGARELYTLDKDIKWLRVVAESGDTTAQYELYQRLASVYHVDQSELLQWLQTAAQNGHASAQYELAMRLEKGDEAMDLALDIDESVRWLKKSAQQGHEGALIKLITAYKSGLQGLPLDLNETIKLQKQLVQVRKSNDIKQRDNVPIGQSELDNLKALKIKLDSSDTDTLKELAFQQLELRTPESSQRGIAFLQRAANQHDTDAQYELGKIYAYGRYNIPKDSEKLVFWWSKAAQDHHLKAIEGITHAYLNGHFDIDKDYQKAQEYIKELIRIYQGNEHDEAKKDSKITYWEGELARIQDQIQDYMGGEFIPLDQLRRYASGGEPQAQYQLAQQLLVMYGYTHPLGVESLGWHEKAAEAGHAQAQWKMFHIKSQGVITNTTDQHGRRTQVIMEKNENEAVRYLKLAAANHHPQAMRELGLSYAKGRHGINKNLEKARDVLAELVAAQADNRYQWDVDNNFTASNIRAYDSVKRSLLMTQVMRKREQNTSPLVQQLLDIKKQFKSEYRQRAHTACLPNAMGACTKQLNQKVKDQMAKTINIKRDRKIKSLLSKASSMDKKIWALVKEADDEIERRSKVAFASLKQSPSRTYDVVVNELLQENLDLLEKRDGKISELKRQQVLQPETP